MILPATYSVTLLLLILSMLSWGSWANTQKLVGKWRFELFYFDYSFGVLLLAVIAAFTFGSLGTEGFGVMDNIAITGKKNLLYGFAGGVVFNLANMLLVAAISVAGLAVAFPVGIGLALVIGVIWSYVLNPQGNRVLLFTGAALVVLAIVTDAIAYRWHAAAKAAASRKHGVRMTGVILSLVSGVLMGSFYPLVELGKAGDLMGLGPYSIGLIFALGVFFSTFLFNIYFMNLPVQGDVVKFSHYVRGTSRQHLLGILGGVVWSIGAISNFVAASAPREVNVGPAVSYALGQGATMVSTLWGLLVWKEFAGATGQVKTLLTVMMVLFLAGLGLVSVAPLY